MVKSYCVRQKKQTECENLRVIKLPKVVDLCFGALVLNVE